MRRQGLWQNVAFWWALHETGLVSVEVCMLWSGMSSRSLVLHCEMSYSRQYLESCDYDYVFVKPICFFFFQTVINLWESPLSSVHFVGPTPKWSLQSAPMDHFDGPSVLRGGWSQTHLKKKKNTLKTKSMYLKIIMVIQQGVDEIKFKCIFNVESNIAILA